MMPTPRSKPSSTTYAVSINATIQNQRVPITIGSLGGERLRLGCMVGRERPGLNVVVDEDDPQQREHRVHAEEAEQREQAVARVYMRGSSLRGADESVDEPWLAADFGGHPTGGGSDVGQRPTEQDAPQDPARGVKFAAPEQERCNRHQRAEPRAQPDHDVVAVEQ